MPVNDNPNINMFWLRFMSSSRYLLVLFQKEIKFPWKGVCGSVFGGAWWFFGTQLAFLGNTNFEVCFCDKLQTITVFDFKKKCAGKFKFKPFSKNSNFKNHETPPPHSRSLNIIPQLNPIKRNKDFIASVDFWNVTERFNGTSPPRRVFPANGGGMKVMKILISQPRIIIRNRNFKVFNTSICQVLWERRLEWASWVCEGGSLLERTVCMNTL